MKPRELGKFGCDFASFVFLCSTVFVSRVQLGDLGTVACKSSNGTQSCIDCAGPGPLATSFGVGRGHGRRGDLPHLS